MSKRRKNINFIFDKTEKRDIFEKFGAKCQCKTETTENEVNFVEKTA